VPYPFAHPAAVLPLAAIMGRFAVPSALAIGSVVPDLWYFVPALERSDTHVGGALLWFCLPLGLGIYLLFHLLLKQPLIALLSPRLAGFSPPGLPKASWYAVLVSLIVGGATHMFWDGLVHADEHSAGRALNWLQHASTAAGSAMLAWWVWRKLRRAPRGATDERLSPRARTLTIAALATAAACAAWLSVSGFPNPDDIAALRQLLRTAASAAVVGLTLALFVYCAIWRLGKKR
jgi:hypothetical protein